MAGMQVVPVVPILAAAPQAVAIISVDVIDVGELLGEGTYGTIHRAIVRRPQNQQQSQPMALKTNKERETAWDQLKQEIRILSRLSHPNVVEFVAQVDDPRRPERVAFLMELALGSASSVYKNRRDDHGVFNLLSEEGTRLALCYQLIYAVEYIHKMGIVHGDISCNNVLLKRDNDSLMAKLSDCGSSFLDGETPQFITGTKYYCSEEVLRKIGCTQASDVFSLAGTFYFLRYGSHPSPPGDAAQYAMHGGGRLGMPAFTQRSIPPWKLNDPLEALLHQAMDPVPENRPSIERIAGAIAAR